MSAGLTGLSLITSECNYSARFPTNLIPLRLSWGLIQKKMDLQLSHAPEWFFPMVVVKLDELRTTENPTAWTVHDGRLGRPVYMNFLAVDIVAEFFLQNSTATASGRYTSFRLLNGCLTWGFDPGTYKYEPRSPTVLFSWIERKNWCWI